MTSNIESTIQRTKRYWYDDGLSEMGAGAVFLAICLLFAFESRMPDGSPLRAISAFGLPVIVIAGGWLVGRAVRAAKERISFPRTGYVAYRKPPVRRRAIAMGVAFGIAVGLVAALAYLGPLSTRWIPFLDGLIIGSFMLYVAFGLGIPRFYAQGVASVLFGAGAVRYTTDVTLGTALYFGATALVLLLSGLAVLKRYMSHTEPPTANELAAREGAAS